MPYCGLYLTYLLLDLGHFRMVIRRVVIASDDPFQDVVYPLLRLAVDRRVLVLICVTGGAGSLFLAPGIISVDDRDRQALRGVFADLC